MNAHQDDRILAAMAIDPLGVAEEMTGKSYKDDEPTMMTGLAIQQAKRKRLDGLLAEANDTYWGVSWGEFTALLEREGFRTVYTEKFMGHGYSGTPTEETFIVAWRDGVLVRAETFGGEQINTCEALLNVDMGTEVKFPTRSFSGSLTEHDGRFVYVGHFDGREGLLTKLRRAAREGTILQSWIKRPFLWLLNYSETDAPQYDYKGITARKVAQLPAEVLACMGPEEEN